MEPLTSQVRLWRQVIRQKNSSGPGIADLELEPGHWDAPGTGNDPGIPQGWVISKQAEITTSAYPSPLGSVITIYTFTRSTVP